MIEHKISIAPLAKPRMTQRDKWQIRPIVARYRAYCDELRLWQRQEQYVLPDKLCVVFHIPMPPSWSKRKRLAMEGAPHGQKPDLDNLLKGIMDALCSQDDAYVWNLQARKEWAFAGAIWLYDY